MNRLAIVTLLFLPWALSAGTFSLESSAFQQNGMIPNEYSCKGSDQSPPLSWNNIPEKAFSLALVVTDPDAPDGAWTHWILFNIPTTQNQLASGATSPEGSGTAKNSWGNARYQGPCPPIGAHRYVFTLYALDVVLQAANGASKDSVLDEMTGHVIAKSELIGLFQTLPGN